MNFLSIQSHVVYGHVGNCAAVFPLQRLGHEVWPIHTVQFSNHPGYGDFTGQVFDAGLIRACMAGLERRGVLASCDGLLSGYVGSAAAGEAVLKAATSLRAANPDALYCCDPVLGDTGKGLYVLPEVAQFMRDAAVSSADVLTPNQFEVEYLVGFGLHTMDDLHHALRLLHARGPRIILVTSLLLEDVPGDSLDLAVSDGRSLWRLRTPRLPLTVNGAGDCIAALFFAHYRVTGSPAQALGLAASSVHGLLVRTLVAGQRELALVEAQEEFVRPSRMFAAKIV